jgi:MFS family permease
MLTSFGAFAPSSVRYSSGLRIPRLLCWPPSGRRHRPCCEASRRPDFRSHGGSSWPHGGVRADHCHHGGAATVGLLLGYAATGAFATVRLILLCAVQGLAAGGELGVAGTLILEAAPRSGNGGRALSNSAASEWAGDDRWPCYGAGRRHGTCGGSDPGLTLAPDLDQIDAGIPQRVNESPERGIV